MPAPHRCGTSKLGVVVETTCPVCREPQTTILTPQEYEEYYNRRELAQVALARLSKEKREVLISGTCGPCWDKLWPPEGGDADPPAAPPLTIGAVLADKRRRR